MSDIRVSIFEDHKAVRQVLEELINSSKGFVLTGSFPNASQVIRKLETNLPDVVLMDIQMPGVSGIDAVSTIKQHFPSIQVIVQTVFDDTDRVFAAIRAGASGYVLKKESPEKFLEYITEAYHGGAPLTGTIALKVLDSFRTQAPKQTEEYHLSSREQDILTRLVKGLSYKMIADECGITYDTVRFHIKNIYAKLHVSSMTEAVAKAINRKLV